MGLLTLRLEKTPSGGEHWVMDTEYTDYSLKRQITLNGGNGWVELEASVTRKEGERQ